MTELIKGYDKEFLEHILDYEGFDYFFTSYVNVDNILDPELKEAVTEYQDAGERIEKILDKHGVVWY